MQTAEPDALARTETAAAPAAPARSVEPPAPAPEPARAPEPPPPPTDVWDRIRAGLRLEPISSPLVQDWERYYSQRPEYFARMVERSSRFLYHVIEEVERRKMPAEIALLPMIESAYNPQAYSRAHASGMWQFIPSTGKLYGLNQDFWYDGRRDVLAATSAALDYLEKLHGMFNDWNLALASYNWGEGAVARAISRNQARGLPADYESLTMPAETRNYIPKLQAVKNIIANPEQYGITLASVPNRPYFATVTTSRHIDVRLAASLAEISLEEFRSLNPAHNKPVIKSNGQETIVLPIEKVAVFQSNLEAHDQPLATWQIYTVKRSDKPEQIAAKHGMTLAQLKEINGITGGKNIVAGQTLLVPIKGTAEPNLPDLPAPKITRTTYRGKQYRCTMKTSNGQRRVVPCAAPKKPAAVKAAKKPSIKM
ncbi:MAG TPA: transglycosylase SLT domain-containing protein [Burkholderiales bacterium]|nr:transglycosylase SLT domain-containing protein [Burkholderiales bacterium]